RCKIINVSDRSKWDLVELPNVTEAQIRFYFEITKGKKYDLWGGVGRGATQYSQQQPLFLQ
ncbi:hypothetical protein ACN9N6_01280, partial [Glaesserella parasuis]